MPEPEKLYQNCLDYLYSFVDYSLTRNFRFTPEKFDLARMADLLALMDNPQSRFSVLHVAGTKGKGSISALIASALLASGHKVGFYTSPHLQDFNERIQVNGIPIPHSVLAEMVEQMKPLIDQVKYLTTFEITTALAFQYFARQGVDVAVIEVGLGGRLDATNVVDPLVSIISSISYDHMNVLGNSLSQIAAEKSGIIKPGRPVVISPQKEEAKQVIEQIARERQSRIVEVDDTVCFAPWTHSLDGQTMILWEPSQQEQANQFIESGGKTEWQPRFLNLPLLGYHQVENAATAYVALKTAQTEGLSITEDSIKRGFANVFWPGRFEVLQKDPAVVVDSAHNRDSGLKLRLAIEDYLPNKKIILLFGASEDKDIQGMFKELLPRVDRVIATQSTHPRAMSAEKLVELAHRMGKPAMAVTPVEKAVEDAVGMLGPDTVLVAAGSLFVAAAVRETWQNMGQAIRSFEMAEYK